MYKNCETGWPDYRRRCKILNFTTGNIKGILSLLSVLGSPRGVYIFALSCCLRMGWDTVFWPPGS